MPSGPKNTIRFSRSLLLSIVGLMLAPWVIFARWAATHPSSITARTASSTEPEHGAMQTAPWGDLESVRILLEPPDEFVADQPISVEPPPWFFKGYTNADLEHLWRSAGLSADEMTFVRDPAHRRVEPEALIVLPTREFILGLSSTARVAVYTVLAQFSQNGLYQYPYRFPTAQADSWFEGSGVARETEKLTRQLWYQRGTAMCFSDAEVVLATIQSPADRIRYIKTLDRRSALLVRLFVHPGEDVDPLVAYWSRGGLPKDIRPLLQSLARRPQGGSIDIAHLLPPLARMLLNTYPLPNTPRRDCHWTSFNFHHSEPDDQFSNVEYLQRALTTNYYPVPGEPELGDIVFFVRDGRFAIHSCVYVAADIVFTKNGSEPSTPWILENLADVESFYADSPNVEVRRYRAKNL